MDKQIWDELRLQKTGKIGDRGCRFLVFGRARDDRFQSLKDIELPSELRSICDEVPEAEFRVDVSSSALRSRNCDDATDMA